MIPGSYELIPWIFGSKNIFEFTGMKAQLSSVALEMYKGNNSGDKEKIHLFGNDSRMQ